MIDFELTVWDYLTFATFMALGVCAIVIFVWIAGLPSRIAIERKHPHACMPR